jgi:hypothetical protein
MWSRGTTRFPGAGAICVELGAFRDKRGRMADDGPSFLSAPPSVPVEPSQPRGIVLQPATTPYRAPAEIATSKPKAIATPKPAKREVTEEREVIVEQKQDWDSVGDRAGEHLLMGHGKYSAWTHVVIAFVLEAIVLGAVPMLIFAGFGLGEIGYAIGLAIGAVGAIWVFANRWRCIEAFASKFCSGLMNLSLLYVPFVAFVYANTRALGKLHRMIGSRRAR